MANPPEEVAQFRQCTHPGCAGRVAFSWRRDGRPSGAALCPKHRIVPAALTDRVPRAYIQSKPSDWEARSRRAKELYELLGTLQAAGDEMGITRERVRQLIVRGVRNGLFADPIHKSCPVSIEELITELRSGKTLRELAERFKVSIGRIMEWLEPHLGHSQSWEELNRAASIARLEAKKEDMRNEYSEVVRVLGHHPTTTELQRDVRGGRALNMRIIRCWGSMEAFRFEQGFPQPKQGNPRFREDVQERLAERRLMFRMRRREIASAIIELLRNQPGLGASDLRAAVGGSKKTVRAILDDLISADKIECRMLGSKKSFFVRGDEL